MAALGSQSEGDTQPISEGVIEEYNNRTKLQEAAKRNKAFHEGTGETHGSTERSYHPGQTGHVDLVGAFDQPSKATSDGVSDGDDEDFDHLSPTTDVRAELYPESKRFQIPKTPATNSKKRDHAGDFINRESSTSKAPINPFADQVARFDIIMGASQAFEATQAISSPLTQFIPSDGLSQRPSPDIYNIQRPASPDPLSSPSRTTGLGVVRAPNEPHARYISMQESQAERDRLAKRNSASLNGSISPSSDGFGSDDSRLRRRRFQREIALKAKTRFEEVKAPARPSSSSRNKNKQPISANEPLRYRFGNQPSDPLTVSDDIPMNGNITEDETEQEEEDCIESDADELGEYSEENKENVDVPMTISKADGWKTQILASQPTPSRQHPRGSQNMPLIDQAKGSRVAEHSCDSNREEYNKIIETQTSAIVDSQPSSSYSKSPKPLKRAHSDVQTKLGVRNSDPKVQSSQTLEIPFVVPSSSPALANKPHALLTSGLHKESDINNDELSINPIPVNDNQDASGFTPQSAEPSNSSKTIGPSNHPNAKPPEHQAGALIGKTHRGMPQKIPQIVLSATKNSTASCSSPLGEAPPATPPNADEISNTKHIETPNKYIDTFAARQTSQSPARIISKPSYSAQQEVSTGSTPFEAAQASLVDSKLNSEHLQRHSSERTISSPSVPLRSIAQIAGDPSPPDALGEVDVDINLLTNDDVEFRAAIKGSSPVRPIKRRKHPDGEYLETVIETSHKTPNNFCQDAQDDTHQNTTATSQHGAKLPSLPKDINNTTTTATANDEVAEQTPKIFRGSRGRPGKPHPSEDIEVHVEETKGKSTLNHNKSHHPPPTAVAAPVLRMIGSDEVAAYGFSAPDRVFAHFNGNFPAYYPATCLGVVGVDQSRYKVRFDDATEDVIGGFGIKRLELRAGDNIKVDLGGSRTSTYVVQSLSGQKMTVNSRQLETQSTQEESDPRFPPTDVHGNLLVVVTAKQRQSGGGYVLEDHEISVPVKDIYLTQTMWTHYKDRPYTYKPAKAASLLRIQTPSERPSTPSNLSAHGYCIKTPGLPVPRSTKPASESNKGLFDKMAFAITNVADEDDRQRIAHQITVNAGQILDDGFDELFYIPSLEPTSPAKQSFKKPPSKFSLAQSAQSVGFTCLIADKHCRTAKYIQALALGIPCIATRWIQDCVAREQVLPWGAYLLASGESSFLNGAIRSRILPTYPPNETPLLSIIKNRPKLLDGESILLIMSKHEEDKMKSHPFFTYALGANKVSRVHSIDAAARALAKAHATGESWDWIYSHDNEKQAEKVLFGGSSSAGRKRKSGTAKESETVDGGRKKRPRVVGNEFLIQSLILGQLVESE